MHSDGSALSAAPLRDACILIVEDDGITSLALEQALMDAGAYVVGPATTVSGALRRLNVERVDGAILDINLRDGMATLLIEALQDQWVPFIFATGVEPPPELRERCPGVPVHRKPVSPQTLISSLASVMRPKAAIKGAAHPVTSALSG